MRKNLLVPLAVSLLFFGTAYGQEKAEEPGACANLPGQAFDTQGATHRFRQVGETIEIAIRGDNVPASVADCEPVVLELRWANGGNNGANFNVSLLDSNNRSIYGRQFSGFLSGAIQISLSSYEVRPAFGSLLAISAVPTTVTIESARPFATPAVLSYSVTRVARPSKARGKGEEGNRVSGEKAAAEKEGNEDREHPQRREVDRRKSAARGPD